MLDCNPKDLFLLTVHCTTHSSDHILGHHADNSRIHDEGEQTQTFFKQLGEGGQVCQPQQDEEGPGQSDF